VGQPDVCSRSFATAPCRATEPDRPRSAEDVTVPGSRRLDEHPRDVARVCQMRKVAAARQHCYDDAGEGALGPSAVPGFDAAGYVVVERAGSADGGQVANSGIRYSSSPPSRRPPRFRPLPCTRKKAGADLPARFERKLIRNPPRSHASRSPPATRRSSRCSLAPPGHCAPKSLQGPGHRHRSPECRGPALEAQEARRPRHSG
jgi:hypothetical protein